MTFWIIFIFIPKRVRVRQTRIEAFEEKSFIVYTLFGWTLPSAWTRSRT